MSHSSLPGWETVLDNAICMTSDRFFFLLSLHPQSSHISSEYTYDHTFPTLTCCSVVLTEKKSDGKECKTACMFTSKLYLVNETHSMHSSYMCSLFCLTYHRDLAFYCAHQIFEWKEMS